VFAASALEDLKISLGLLAASFENLRGTYGREGSHSLVTQRVEEDQL
jgi:hypothetical protein